jgi:hypothetical protein
MNSARERYLYEADWHRRRAQVLQTAAIVQACLGDDDGARQNLKLLVDELFPENARHNEQVDKKLSAALETWKDRALPVIPSFHPAEGMDLLPRIETPELEAPIRPAKKAWGAPDEGGA